MRIDRPRSGLSIGGVKGFVVMRLAVFVALIGLLAGCAFVTNSASAARVGGVSFDPVARSVFHEHIVPKGVTFYGTRIVWHFADGTALTDFIETDWFFSDGLTRVRVAVPVNPPSMQSLAPSTPERPANYVRTPTIPPAGAILTGVDVSTIAWIRSDGSAFGGRATLRARRIPQAASAEGRIRSLAQRLCTCVASRLGNRDAAFDCSSASAPST